MKGDKIYFRDEYKYQLARTYSVQIDIRPESDIITDYILLNSAGWLTIMAGYAFDGPSGPTIDTKSAMRGSLVHDAGYQLLRLGRLAQETRKDWDTLYRQLCVEDGMWRLRAFLHFTALRSFGGAAADPNGEKPVIEAP